MSPYMMPPESVREVLSALREFGVQACVGGGWAVDALVGVQTRQHSDLDVWINAAEFDGLLAACVDQGIDRMHPWPRARPWNFVLHDGRSRRIDLHVYQVLTGGRLYYGGIDAPFLFTELDLSGQGEIAGMPVLCERADFALRNHTGYELRDVDRHDVGLLCEHFALQLPEDYR